ncbi:MAG: helix-turn-helix transcriptional regulator [Pseudomonadota bacterium]
MPHPSTKIGLQKTAAAFNALAHPRRLILGRHLRDAYPAALTFGMLQEKTKFAPTVLAHHLGKMEAGALLKRRHIAASTHFTLTPYGYHALIQPALDALPGAPSQTKFQTAA